MVGTGPPVLFFPGGHCPAQVDCGWSLYRRSGHRVVAFSRPGYGRTQVGALTAEKFAPLVGEVCADLRLGNVEAAVGVSFGGMQAVQVALALRSRVERLVLHSCAPSVLAYPDSRAQAVGGRVAFSPAVEGVLWALLRRLVRSEAGLRTMASTLSTLPTRQWWGALSASDRAEIRRMFSLMRSGTGFVTDLRQAGPDGSPSRRAALARVGCPTLVTGSPNDAGVRFAHAESLARTIPGARLVELASSSHLFWLGPDRDRLASEIAAFLA